MISTIKSINTKYRLVRDWIRYNDGRIQTSRYNQVYNQADIAWFLHEYIIRKTVEEELNELLDLSTGETFWIYQKVNHNRVILNKLENSHLMLILSCAN